MTAPSGTADHLNVPLTIGVRQDDDLAQRLGPVVTPSLSGTPPNSGNRADSTREEPSAEEPAAVRTELLNTYAEQAGHQHGRAHSGRQTELRISTSGCIPVADHGRVLVQADPAGGASAEPWLVVHARTRDFRYGCRIGRSRTAVLQAPTLRFLVADLVAEVERRLAERAAAAS